MAVVRDGPFICAAVPRQRGLRSFPFSSQVDRTALAASALLLLSSFVVSAVAPPTGRCGNCTLEEPDGFRGQTRQSGWLYYYFP